MFLRQILFYNCFWKEFWSAGSLPTMTGRWWLPHILLFFFFYILIIMFCFPRWFLSFHYSSLCLPSFKSNLSRLCLRICGVFLVLYFNEFICTNESQICLYKTCFGFNHFVCIPIFLSKTVCSWRMGPWSHVNWSQILTSSSCQLDLFGQAI